MVVIFLTAAIYFLIGAVVLRVNFNHEERENLSTKEKLKEALTWYKSLK